MTIEKELAALAKFYAKFDPDQQAYVSHLDKNVLLRLDADFIKVVNKLLLAQGPAKENILKNYRKISLYFHPDRRPLFLPEVIWLEQQLGESVSDGICFKTLHTCYEKLTSPQKFKEICFADIKNREDCKAWLEKLKNKAGTYSARNLCDSLIALLDESGNFFDEVGKITPQGLRTLITSMPLIFASYGAIIFAEELFAVYSLYFLILKGGQFIGLSQDSEMKQFGSTLQDFSMLTATATTTLLVRLLEMTFWASRHCFATSLQIGSALLSPIFTEFPKPSKNASARKTGSESSFFQELIQASHSLSEGIQFKTPELKIIAAPLEADLTRLNSQFFGDWRIGKTKRLSVESFLFRMRVLDSSAESIEHKLAGAYQALDLMKDSKEVYTPGGRTAQAIDMTEQVLQLYLNQENASAQLSVSLNRIG